MRHVQQENQQPSQRASSQNDEQAGASDTLHDTIEVRTPCRLHFGLLALNRDDTQRQFGGAGVMIDRPHIAIRVTRSPTQKDFTAAGPLAKQAIKLAAQFQTQAAAQAAMKEDQSPVFTPLQGGHIEILQGPRAHTGLGTGTQLGMAIACALTKLSGQFSGQSYLSIPTLATMVGRGKRSAIGAYGFGQGGFIVEGGKLDHSRLSPLLIRHDFPKDWRLVLISPSKLQGLAGSRELQAFAQMPDINPDITGQMCRLVLLGLTPAMLERDLPLFGQSLYELQNLVGQCFAQAQGGIWADPMLEAIVTQLRNWGIAGVGQSSWGPTLYAVTGDEEEATSLSQKLQQAFLLSDDEVTITAANNTGGQWQWV